LAHDVRDRLLGAVRAGAYPGGRLPPEEELARDLGVSRATVRAALQSLAEDGIVSRRRRHGTVVNKHMLTRNLPLNRLVSFRDLIEQSGYEASVDPLRQRVDAPAAEIRSALGLRVGEKCLVVERLLRADRIPVIVVIDVVAVRWLHSEPGEAIDADTTFGFIAQNTNDSASHSLLEIVPSVATDDEPLHLGLVCGTPYAELRELIFTPANDPIAFSRVAVDCRRVSLTLVRREV
jgi:GntR family transcriptional regulator